ncbi:MAG: hypothetical protein F6K19_45115 [Cyanothece sp. SIO1E1]|nr:hypothetical protein [Cyanothece sp. SIO1E1]
MENISAHIDAHTPAHYTAQQLAEEYGVADSTLRTRWYPWLLKVAPEPLLKHEGRFTELARTLFSDFAQNVKQGDMKSEDWVVATKTKYAQEWGSAGVIEGELMPDEVGGVLALMQSQNTNLQHLIDTEMRDLQDFIDQVNETETNFSEAELQAFRANGAKRGIARFKLETQTELEVYNVLKQKRMQGGN